MWSMHMQVHMLSFGIVYKRVNGCCFTDRFQVMLQPVGFCISKLRDAPPYSTDRTVSFITTTTTITTTTMRVLHWDIALGSESPRLKAAGELAIPVDKLITAGI